MSTLPPVTPATNLSDIYPADTVFAPRTTLALTNWVHTDSMRLDTATGMPLTILGNMPLICHENTCTPVIIDFFRRAGIALNGNIITYHDLDKAIAIANQYLLRGQRLIYYYPPPPPLDSDAGLVIPLSLYGWLNDKANLEDLCDAQYLPPSRLYPPGRFMEAADEFHDKTVFLKACFAGASGAGTDIRYCVDSHSRLAAIVWFTARESQLTALRMEVDVPVTSCWCVNLAINESGIRYLGAATQVFSRPGLQSGSLIDPTDQPTSEIINITLAIGNVARQRGYVGIAGFDIGIDASGHAWVFDLNFRKTACTVQILLHDSACRRINGRISQSLGLNIPGPLAPALERLTPFVDSGCFVPQRLYERTPGVDQFSVITAILIATDQDEVNSIEAAINDAINDLLSVPDSVA